MVGRSKHSTAEANTHLQPSVHGLDAGRAQARRAQRRRRRGNRIVTTVLTVVMVVTVGGAGWLAYTAYVDHDNSEQLESDRRVAEIERQRIGRTTDDIINELEETPAWNGPGNPTFGVGDEAEQP